MFHKARLKAAAMGLQGKRSDTDMGVDFAVVREKQGAYGLFFIRNQALTNFRSKARSSNQIKATSMVSQEPNTNTPRT